MRRPMRPSMRPPVACALFLLGAAVVSVVVPSTARATDAEQSVVVSETPAVWTPHVLNGEVMAVAQVGDDIVIGGSFTQLQNVDSTGHVPAGAPVITQPHLAAFDAKTGVVDAGFTPSVNGNVNALYAAGSTVYVGGEFTTVDGAAQQGVARLALDGTRFPGFTGHLDNGIVFTLVVSGSHVYVGGRFSKVGGVARAGLAALNAATGAPDSSLTIGVTQSRNTAKSLPFVRRLDVSADGTTMVLGGNFQAVGGLPRNQLAAINLTNGTMLAWATDLMAPVCSAATYSYVRDLAFSPDGGYFAVVTGGGPKSGTLCDSATRWERPRIGMPSGQKPTWIDYTGGDTLTAVAVTGTAVYVAGHQRWLNNFGGSNAALPGAVDREGIGALDPVSGIPYAWNPSLQRNEEVGDLVATADGLWVGYDANLAGNYPRPRIAMFPVVGGTAVPGVQDSTLPRNMYVSGTDGSLVRRSYDGTSFGSAVAVPSPGTVPWGTIRGAFMAAGKVYYVTADAHLMVAPFDGTTVGTPVDTGTTYWSSLSSVQGMTYDSGRLYYVLGDGRLYYRWFSPASGIVGTQPITVTNSGFTDATQLAIAGGSLYFARADHKLYRQALAGDGVTGSAVAVSGSGLDGLTWDGTSLFLANAPMEPVVRLYGSDRIATAIATSQAHYGDGAAGAVVLARYDAFADGLAGAPLASDRHAPLLLNPPTTLDPRVAAEIQRVLPSGGTVYELGGTASIGAGVDAAVKALGYATVRLGGADRFATSVAIAGALPGATRALVATGMDFPDALGAGAAAGSQNGIVLLSNKTTLPASVKAYLDAHPALEVWGVGGQGAAAAAPYITAPARSLIGADRYQTATKLADAMFPSPTHAVVVNGLNFPDGLSGGPYASWRGGPVLLTPQSTLAATADAYLTAHAGTITGASVLGGPVMVGTGVMTQIGSAIS